MSVRVLLVGLLLWGAGAAGIVGAAERCAECVTAGATSAAFHVPPGTPLAGYGSLKRRLLFPDVLGRYPHAFWFSPSAGERDPLMARALVLESGAARLAWVTVDLVAVDRAFTRAVQERLARGGVAPATLIISASHTHSGPGAFMDSALMGLVAVDRIDAAVRDALVEGTVMAIRQADGARVPALVATTSVTAPAVTASRLGRPLDPEIVVLKVTTGTGAPLALVWNFSIHGTMLGARNRSLSGDVMGAASRQLERRLGVPALFVNGAVGDVSPARHGEAALTDAASALAGAVAAGWERAARARAAGLRVSARRIVLPSPAVRARNCFGRWVPGLIAIPLGAAMPADAELIAGSLGDAAWVTIPGELQTALGVTIKREARGLFAHPFVAGLSNDYLGYFVTPEDYGRPAYLTCASLYGPDAGACLAETAAELLQRLPDRQPPQRAPSRCGTGSAIR